MGRLQPHLYVVHVGIADREVSEKIAARDPMEEIRRAFSLFDDDGTGKISLRNLKRVAKELGENLDDEELYVSHADPPSPKALR